MMKKLVFDLLQFGIGYLNFQSVDIFGPIFALVWTKTTDRLNENVNPRAVEKKKVELFPR